jgi:exopolysaccharide biosynthesis polyprenyl glycosylphosphotransferase
LTLAHGHGVEVLTTEVEHEASKERPGIADRSPRRNPTARRFSVRERSGPWRDVLRRRLLAGSDVISAMAVSATLALSGRHAGASLLAAIAFAPVWVLLAKLQGLYDRDHRRMRHLTSDELPNIITWAVIGTAALAGWLELTTAAAPSAVALIRAAAALAALASVLRAATRTLWRSLTPAERVGLVGSGALAHAVARKLEVLDDMHLEIVAVVDDERLFRAEHSREELAALLAPADEGLGRVVLASDRIDGPLVTDLVELCRDRSLKLSLVPPAGPLLGGAVQLAHLGELPMIEYGTWDVSRSTALLKRGIDVSVSATLLVLLAPLLVLVGMWVRLDSPGGALFAQSRAGRHGRPFRMWKIRTMQFDAELQLASLVELAALAEPVFKLRSDPRVTPAGRRLRRWSIDELPQLWNVLRGEMSLVGPRPEQVELVARYGPDELVRVAVKPGMTGPVQIQGRGELRLDERVAADRAYIESMSLSGDMRILVQTIAAVVRGRGAF